MLARIEAALQRHPRTITRLRDLLGENTTFAKIVWVVRAKQLLALDYPVTSTPRYGHGKPPHPRLHELISQNDESVTSVLRRALTFTEELASIAELPSPGSGETSWRNGWLPPLDMVANYTLLATCQPQRYLEIGSGESTKLARKAVRDHDLGTEIISIDPAPRAEVDALCDRVVRRRLEDVDLQVFDAVEPGDFVFFDGSHRSFMNSDVSVFFLEVLPQLPSGTIVGVHDIDLPWDYSPDWAVRCYNEQYLLAVYLLTRGPGNHIVFPSRHVAVTPELAEILSPLWTDPRLPEIDRIGRAFWMTI